MTPKEKALKLYLDKTGYAFYETEMGEAIDIALEEQAKDIMDIIERWRTNEEIFTSIIDKLYCKIEDYMKKTQGEEE